MRDVAKDLCVKYSTVARVCRTFLREERLDRKKRPGPKVTYNISVQHKVEAFFSNKPQATLLECKQHLATLIEKVPSLSTINRILKKMKISLKTISVVPAQRNSEETIEKRRRFALKFLNLESKGVNFVWIDEFGCSIALKRGRARSRVGLPAIVIGPGRGTNLSVAAAIDLDGPVHFMHKYGSIDQFAFANFLRGLAPKLDASKENILIMDNLRVHDAPEVVKVYDECKLKRLFLPPWSPMFNPIEECFSKVKLLISKYQSSGSALLDSVQMAFDAVTAQDCIGWFRHTKQFFPQALSSQPINVRPEEIESSSEPEMDGLSDESDELVPTM